MSTETKNVIILIVFLCLITILTLACLVALNVCIRRIPPQHYQHYAGGHRLQPSPLPPLSPPPPPSSCANAATAAAICVNPDGSLAVGMELSRIPPADHPARPLPPPPTPL